ncbi:MAG: glycoside hydrolase family 2 [Bacteroidales bacterium]|nr:glycoside hydrolase family 2 [Bacteroidales bacterium]
MKPDQYQYRINFFRLVIFFLIIGIKASLAQETEKIYLSGTGSDQTVDWQFYCTGGRNSGQWTTIPVPSNWELHGFGTYNYGHDKDSLRGKESGLYRYSFRVPDAWKNRKINIIFEGSMTDTRVKINGIPAGPEHQGAFYRFQYDITGLVLTGKKNLLEVRVDKHSANSSVNRAERFADYWIFGGIYRPVYLEAYPAQHIDHIFIDARSDGEFIARVYLDGIVDADEVSAQIFFMDGQRKEEKFNAYINKDKPVVTLRKKISSPLLWSPEFPNLYVLRINLLKDGKPLHTIDERFGFRTVELRERDGIYLNGKKIKFRGICRHSFWPSSGRTTSKKMSIMDVELMKEMNMNAVRNSHYPADAHFYDVCDSLGLLVLDELGGWHDAYDTETGQKLVNEMLTANMNHPSIVMWVNGNEGGHNTELLPLFDTMDIQRRPVIQAWEIFRGMDTQHYINYSYGNGTHFQGHDVFFPTEFLHGLYDGGHGAGLEDYWELMYHHPLCAGGFLWDFADEGVVRTDRNGQTDTDGNHAADGIVGPYREKEGSFYTVKEVWAPIRFEHKEITPDFEGKFTIENRFLFTNISQCTFTYQVMQFADPFYGEKKISKPATIEPPDIAPGEKGTLSLNLPADWKIYDILYITAFDPPGRDIYTWSWPLAKPEQVVQKMVSKDGPDKISVVASDSLLTVTANGTDITFNSKTGLLQKVQNMNGIIPFGNGPVLCEGVTDYQSMKHYFDEENVIVEYTFGKRSHFNELKWTIYPSGWLKLDVKYCPAAYESTFLGISFYYPENQVKGVRWMGDGPYRVWKNRLKGNALGVWHKDYNNTITGERDFIYPEFKGYHSRLYWAQILTTSQPFTILCASEDIFLCLFTPDPPKDPYNTAPPFPTGDISFMHGIPPIGTKSQVPENMGPMGTKNRYYDYGKTRPKEMTLYFDFAGNLFFKPNEFLKAD